MITEATLTISADGVLIQIGDRIVKVYHENDALYSQIIEAMNSDRQPAPVVQEGSRKRFRAPIQANRSAAGDLTADFGDLRTIEQRILGATGNKTISQTNRTMLNAERVFIIEAGRKDTHPSPADLYDELPLFREYVDQCILWQQQNAQNSSSRVSVTAIVRTLANYRRPKSGWLDWRKSRMEGNAPLPQSPAKQVKMEVITPRGSTET